MDHNQVNSAGFTLLEMLIAGVILVVAATGAYLFFSGIIKKSNDIENRGNAVQELAMLLSQLEIQFAARQTGAPVLLQPSAAYAAPCKDLSFGQGPAGGPPVVVITYRSTCTGPTPNYQNQGAVMNPLLTCAVTQPPQFQVATAPNPPPSGATVIPQTFPLNRTILGTGVCFRTAPGCAAGCDIVAEAGAFYPRDGKIDVTRQVMILSTHDNDLILPGIQYLTQ